MVPRCAVEPLQHDFARRIDWIQEHVRDQRFARIDRQSGRGFGEVMVVSPGRENGLVRERAGEVRWIFADPLPVVSATDSRPGPCRHGILNPNQRASRGVVVREGDRRAVGRADDVSGIGTQRKDHRFAVFDFVVINRRDRNHGGRFARWNDYRIAQRTIVSAIVRGAADSEMNGQ